MAALMKVLEQVMDAAARRDKAAFLTCFTDDVEYRWHVTARPLNGKAWLERFLDRYWGELTDTRWWVDRYVEGDNLLMVEGVEEYVIKASGKKISHPYMGVCEFRDGKIAKMRDYYDMGEGAT